MRGQKEDIRIAVDAACAADVDHHARLLILHAEIRGRGAHQPEGCGVVHSQHSIPLLVGHLDSKSVKVPELAGTS